MRFSDSWLTTFTPDAADTALQELIAVVRKTAIEARLDDATREKLIRAESNALYEKLRVFPPRQRLWILADLSARVARRMRNAESSQYAIDFRDEVPTRPDTPYPAPIQGAPAIETSVRDDSRGTFMVDPEEPGMGFERKTTKP